MKLETVKFLIDAESIERATTFYTRVFGFQTLHSSPFWAEIEFNGVHIGIHGGADTSQKISSLSFQVDDIEQTCVLIVKNGGKIITIPEERPGEPIMLGTFKDPEGNEIMLTKYLGEVS